MIVCHRAPSSLNITPYRPIWTHFRSNFMIFIDLILQTGKRCWHLGLFFGPLGKFLMISWKQKRCATSVRSFWRLYQAISSHMDPFQTNFDANKHSQISRRRRRRLRKNSQIPTCPLSQRTQGSNTSQGPLLRFSKDNQHSRTHVALFPTNMSRGNAC